MIFVEANSSETFLIWKGGGGGDRPRLSASRTTVTIVSVSSCRRRLGSSFSVRDDLLEEGIDTGSVAGGISRGCEGEVEGIGLYGISKLSAISCGITPRIVDAELFLRNEVFLLGLFEEGDVL